MGGEIIESRESEMTQTQKNDRIGRSSSAKPIPHIPLPFEEVMKDVLKVKPPENPKARVPGKAQQKKS